MIGFVKVKAIILADQLAMARCIDADDKPCFGVFVRIIDQATQVNANSAVAVYALVLAYWLELLFVVSARCFVIKRADEYVTYDINNYALDGSRFHELLKAKTIWTNPDYTDARKQGHGGSIVLFASFPAKILS
ncbi:hypothetical protein GCM10007898_30530 [Dyella flagellata]|uniref:Uncharacterized protein n=1 Tax=Dyella flagellata TaxID=1867833 RepID=A0ABQ5XCX5_9GAMM|nr:hypothetical protein GCM10007898_30530 [Dyella flagellata]